MSTIETCVSLRGDLGLRLGLSWCYAILMQLAMQFNATKNGEIGCMLLE